MVGTLEPWVRSWVRLTCTCDPPERPQAPRRRKVAQAAQRRFVPVDDVPTLRRVEALRVDSCQAAHDADVPRLREKRAVVDETPEGNEAVQASGVFVVSEDAPNRQHDRTVMSTGTCLAGS